MSSSIKIVATSVTLAFLLSGGDLQAKPDCLPYIGEQLTFSIGWEFVYAGTSTVSYEKLASGGYAIRSFARTNKFFDMFKKVRDVILSEGICHKGNMQSTRFELNQHENRYKANKLTVFDWQNNRALYTQNDSTDIYDVPVGHLNVLDAFSKVRQLDLQLGSELHIPVFDSRKVYDVVVKVHKKTEMLRAPWGGFVKCVLIEPILKTAGIFSSKGRIKIWMTHDDRHIPIKLTAKIKIGRIIGRLIDYQPFEKAPAL
ncbi:MAG: DUF3108 domain-containing protein [Mariprofundaceae bacterium]